MTYVNNYPAFEELELNRNISLAAMMHKTCPWVFNADETKNVTLSYADKNCVILYSTQSHRTKRSGQPGNDHVTEMTLQSDVTHEIEASLYGEDLCLSQSNFPKNNDEKQVHGSVEENTCMDTIELKIKGTEKHVLSTSHMAITLSNKHFFKKPNDKLTLFFDTLDQDDLETKLSEIQCGIAEDQENPAPWVGSLRTNEDNEHVYSCGAVLIGPRLALTAAHCVQDSLNTGSGFDETWNTFSVRFEQKEFGSFKYVNVKAYVKPMEYWMNTDLAFDIALLILEDIVYDIPPVCLPEISDDFPYRDIYPKLNTTMYSFFKSDDLYETLQIVDFPMSPTSPDKKHLEGGSSMPANRFPVKGSSGSPIISKINEKATLIGILSGAAVTDCASCWDNAMSNEKSTKDDYTKCELDCFRGPAFIVDIIGRMKWLKQYFKMEFTLHEKDGSTRFDSYNQLTDITARKSYRHGTEQSISFGESGSFYQIRILSKASDASVEIFGGSNNMHPIVTEFDPIFKLDEGQQLKVHELPPLMVMCPPTGQIVITTKSPENSPIDDVLRFEVSKLPDIMDFDDSQTCLFPPLKISGPRVISSKFFPSTEIFLKESQCLFRINSLLKANTPIALLINVQSKLTENDKCKKDDFEKDETPSRFCNMIEKKFLQKIGLKTSDRTTPYTDYFLPDYYHCGKSVCYQHTDKFDERCKTEMSCPYPKCCGCQEDCLDKSFCEAFEIKIQTENTEGCEYPCVHEPTVTQEKSVTTSLKQDCLSEEKPSKPKTPFCNPKQTFYEHVIGKKRPKFCLMKKRKLSYFQNKVKNAYVNTDDKKKYELLKLKTELLLNADMLYMELNPKSIDDGKPIGIEILYKPKNFNSQDEEMSPVDFEIYFSAGLKKGVTLKELAESINFPKND
jgi:hypothetical protein